MKRARVAALAVLAAVAAGIYGPAPAVRAAVVLAIVVAVVIWVVGENFGMILAGSATDPNSGPLLVLLAITVVGWALVWMYVQSPPEPDPDPEPAVPAKVVPEPEPETAREFE